ncbi:ATP-dependent DNA helicase RecG [Pontibacter ummariensis]|uniref:ATP-dependent DNA helicase RecG n=1 Tax=Pontibacter ummariensis TaxID=1610492 RepID=A0A239DS19_9BACT|nr:RNA-binding domain-containing protein [Pontibacter ummariensis]PRY13779.1 ATP-dependent DNA helicase RecG [Pontibacter ummariensis]SNS35316.1 ATP-dependent DNA helicase RecG [Pontibacter ummariensis]
MSDKRILQLLQEGEGLRMEFKKASTSLPKNLFETVCAFLNRAGGSIFLGVDDDGSVLGVDPASVGKLKTDLVNLSNNAQKLEPPFILFPEVYDIDGKAILYIQVPESSQVHRTNGAIFDRSEDGDYRLNNHGQIAELYNRKRAHFTENTIYPYLGYNDFKPELFPKVRNLIYSRDPGHPWLAMDDEQLLRTAGFYRRDFATNQEGYTLAAALVFGRDEVIQQVLPHYKIDALVRREDLDRYDDRVYIQTNLIEAYEQLMAFIAKHLPDRFHMEGDVRVSLRTKIFREVVANLIVHREYTNALPATLVIYRDSVITENANRPQHHGLLVPGQFSPFPKNPTIAKFFIQLGRVDELGSGVRNVHLFLPLYSPGRVPTFDDGDVFRIEIPLDHAMAEGSVQGVSEGLLGEHNVKVSERIAKVLDFVLENPRASTAVIAEFTGVSEKTAKRDLKVLRDRKLIQFVGPPKSGHYMPTEELREILKSGRG